MEKKTNGMSVAAVVLAFIFPVVGLVLAIIAKKKDSEDKLAKVAFIISLILLIVGFVSTIGCFGCSVCMIANSDDSTPTSQTTEITTTVVVTETTPIETEPEVTTTEITTGTIFDTTTSNQEDIHESVRFWIEMVTASSGFSESSVTYDEEYDIYTINVQMDGVAEAVMSIKYGIAGDISEWENLKENLKYTCTSIRDFVHESGLESHVVFNVLNDESPDKILISILDGEIVYDVLAE